MKIKLITAVDLNFGIGKNNDLPWKLPADMKFFKEKTLNQIVIMGRKNFDSLPTNFKPLPNRVNVVLSRNQFFNFDNVLVFNDLLKSIDYFKINPEYNNLSIFIIGGGQLYKEALDLNIIDEMYITHIQHSFDVDTFFPNFNIDNWNIEIVEIFQADDKNQYSFIIKKYIKK